MELISKENTEMVQLNMHLPRYIREMYKLMATLKGATMREYFIAQVEKEYNDLMMKQRGGR